MGWGGADINRTSTNTKLLGPKSEPQNINLIMNETSILERITKCPAAVLA